MKKVIAIIGVGPGISLSVAMKFGSEGYAVALISRDMGRLEEYKTTLEAHGIESAVFQYDPHDPLSIDNALKHTKNTLGVVTVLHYNAGALHDGTLLAETADSLTDDFRINVSNALQAIQSVRTDMKAGESSVLLTGGGFAHFPALEYGSLSIGKGALLMFARLLNEELKAEGIFVGTVTISGYVNPSDSKYSPEKIAIKFWELHNDRNLIELIY
ncbi:SDR family NAD(P)-dependent oxidoreductase [Mucilaginibacter terrae]|uniref:SDR family NAD(P)-dependent oxidoreductase n=1 Tax=Mucilaginibacter terrae TaxID=1955052 RepID=UPI00363C05CC